MFIKENFSHVHTGGPTIIRQFVYQNEKDTLQEIMVPGYFKSQKIILKRNSFIKIVCKDAIAEIVVKDITGLITMWPQVIMAKVLAETAADHPHKGPKGKPGRKPGRKPAKKPGRKPKVRNEETEKEAAVAIAG